MSLEPNKTALAPDASRTEAEAAPAKQEVKQKARGNWFHRHRSFTKEPVTYAGYQMFRSTMATIPYGFGMAGVLHGFGWLSNLGTKIGLTDKGRDLYYETLSKVDPVTNLRGGPAGAAKAAVDVFSESERALLHKPGLRGQMGRNLIRFSNSPINQAIQIGLAFSMFRFTGGLIKTLRDKVMDEKNTAEDTKRETDNWKQTLGDTAKTNWKAEATGTFWAALTLGFIGALVQHTTPYFRLNKKTVVEGVGEVIQKESFRDAIKRVWDKPAKLLQNAAIWTVSYATFFEVDERIQKDWKLREGTWKGHANSLVNAPGATITGQPPKEDGEKHERTKFAAFTQDPGLPRLVFRRLLPVAVGISAYAAVKRVGYIAGGGQMVPLTRDVIEGGFKTNAKHFLTNSWREGLATATFGVLWMATDAWGSWYDKFFENMQDKTKHTPLNEHQSRNMAALNDRLLAKEAGQGRAA